MKHEFTDTQLRQAVADYLEDAEVDLSISALGDFFWTQQVKALRKMLDALPEPVAEDWQECRFEDIRKGDRVKYETGTTTVIHTDPVQGREANDLILSDGTRLLRHFVQTFYRIPAPVQHPDPAEHPVIYAKDCDIVGFIPKIMVWYRDSYVAGRQCVSPERITGWQQIDPAKVVEDDR